MRRTKGLGRGLRRAVFVGLAFVAAACGPDAGAGDAADLVRVLDEAATKLLKEHGPAYVTVREFGTNLDVKVVYYELGRVNEEALGLPREDPALPIVAAAFELAAWREFTDDASPKFMPPEPRAAIARARAVHEKNVGEYATTSPSAWAEAAPRWRGAYASARKDVVRAVEAYAKEKGLTASTVDRSPASASASVTIEVAPPDGKVRCLPYLQYLLLRQRGVEPATYPWLALAHDAVVPLLGQYQYTAEWTGKPKDNATFFVGGAATRLRFTPGAAPALD